MLIIEGIVELPMTHILLHDIRTGATADPVMDILVFLEAHAGKHFVVVFHAPSIYASCDNGYRKERFHCVSDNPAHDRPSTVLTANRSTSEPLHSQRPNRPSSILTYLILFSAARRSRRLRPPTKADACVLVKVTLSAAFMIC